MIPWTFCSQIRPLPTAMASLGHNEDSTHGSKVKPLQGLTSGPYLEVNDIGCHQHPNALQEIPYHMDEGCPDTGILPPSMTMLTVPMPGLVKRDSHSTGRDEGTGLQ